VEAVRDVFQDLYDQGLTQYDHSAFLLNLEAINTPARLGTGADTPRRNDEKRRPVTNEN